MGTWESFWVVNHLYISEEDGVQIIAENCYQMVINLSDILQAPKSSYYSESNDSHNRAGTWESVPRFPSFEQNVPSAEHCNLRRRFQIYVCSSLQLH